MSTSPPKPLEIDALSPAGGVSRSLGTPLNSLPGETSGSRLQCSWPHVHGLKVCSHECRGIAVPGAVRL